MYAPQPVCAAVVMVILAVSQTCHCLISTYYFGTVGSHRKGRYIPLAALVRRVGASQMSSMQSDLLKQVHAFHALAGVTSPQHMFMQKLIRSASLLLCLSCKTAFALLRTCINHCQYHRCYCYCYYYCYYHCCCYHLHYYVSSFVHVT